jgi:hypothetical protein
MPFTQLNNAEAIPSWVSTLTNAPAILSSPVVPTNTRVELSGIIVANITAAAHTFSLYLHRSTVAAAAGNAVCLNVAIAANTMYIIDGPIIMAAGWQLSGAADANSAVNVTVNGYIVNEAAQ